MKAPNSTVNIYPITAPYVLGWGDSVFQSFQLALKKYPLTLQSGDIIVITSKVVSMEQKARVWLAHVKPTQKAKKLVKEKSKDPRVAQLVIDESQEVFATPHCIMSKTKYGLSASAGIDLSNCPAGYALLLPRNPDQYAADLRQKIKDTLKVNVAVLVIDSRSIPLRKGITGVALGLAGINPIEDEGGNLDLYGSPMKMTKRASADNLAAMANFVMGETSERKPYAVIRGTKLAITDDPVSVEDAIISEDECLYFAPFIQNIKLEKHPSFALHKRTIKDS